MIEVYKWHLPKVKLNKDEMKDGWYTKHLSINIVTINQPEYLKKCLETVYVTTPRDFPPSEINIWENGSTMAIQGVVEQAIKDAGTHPSFVVHFFRHRDNVGFAAAHNVMVGLSGGKYLCMLNDDMEIFEQDWATKMISGLSDDVLQIGAWNESICNRLDAFGHGFCTAPHLTEYIDGAFVVMDMKVARRFGPWDTEVFKLAYCEDPDLSLRIRSLGKIIRIMPIDHIHHRAKTTSKIVEFDLEGYAAINHVRLLNKWNWYFSKRDFWVRIAVVRAAAAGDALMVTSVVSKIRELAPEAVIDVYTRFPMMFTNNPHIDGLFDHKEFANSRQKYHSTIILDNAYERDAMELCYRAYYKAAGMDDEEIAWPELYFDDKEIESAQTIIDNHKKIFGEKPIALFHTGKTNWLGRNLELYKFESVAKYLQGKGWSIIEVGGKETDKMSVESTKLQGVDTIHPRVSMAVISKAELFVGIDSFPWNVAQTCKVPSVVGFGCIDPKTRILDDKLVTAVQSKDKYCLGCHHEYRGPINESQCMRKRTGYDKTISAPCMEDITIDQLIEAVDKHLNAQT